MPSYRVWTIDPRQARRYRGSFKSLNNAFEMLNCRKLASVDGTTIEIRVSIAPWEFGKMPDVK